MIEKILCAIFACISAFSVWIAQKPEYLSTSVHQTMQVDASFIKAESDSCQVRLTSHRKGIQVENCSLSKVGETKTISFEYQSNYDGDVIALVDGSSSYEDEFFRVECHTNDSLSKGEIAHGTVTITLKKATIEDQKLPFNVRIQIQPK
ncbi:MAG: hypothetical protein J6X28_03995 [Bacilli bacterium]|nr:hypothetical protein [Bacilli bacterium]